MSITFNPSNKGGAAVLSNSNLTAACTGTANSNAIASQGVSTGKWYCEITVVSAVNAILGVCNESFVATGGAVGCLNSAGSWGYYANNGTICINNIETAYGATFTTGDVIGIAIDADNKKVTFYKNGVSQGVASFTMTGNTFYPVVGNGSGSTSSYTINFGESFFYNGIPNGYSAYAPNDIVSRIKNSLSGMQVGDIISCEYTASSGSFGSFNNLGMATKPLISKSGSVAVPDGSFYLIHTGYDRLGRMKLIADRNIQTSISWDNLSLNGVATGSGVDVPLRNDDVKIKLSNPSILPAGLAYGISFSPDGNYMAVGHSTTPYITIYKRNGDTFTKLPNPDVLPAGNTTSAVAFSSDGNYLGVGHYNSPFVTIYKRNGDTFTKLPNPDVLPTGTAFGIAFSQDGNYMVVGHDVSPYLAIYKRSGDTFTKLPNPSNLPAGTGAVPSFSPDGNYLAVAHYNSPYVIIYKRDGDTFTKLSNPNVLPTGNANSLAFSPDGKYLAVAHFTTPFLTIYKRNGDTFTKLTNPSVLPASTGVVTSFSSDGNYLSVAHFLTPFVTTYKRDGDTFTKLPNPSSLPSSNGYGLAFSPDGKYMAVGTISTPFLTIYKSSVLNETTPGLKNLTVKIPTGGINSSDYVNEWDQIIVNSSLDGIITPGNNGIWNWSGVYSFTTTSNTTSNRTRRGNVSAGGYDAGSSSVVGANLGFRPMLLADTAYPPDGVFNLDRFIIFDDMINISGNATSAASLDISFRVSVNTTIKLDWTAPVSSPAVLNTYLNYNDFINGSNIITIEVKDSDGGINNYDFTVIKKDIESTLIDSANPSVAYNESDKLYVTNTRTSLLGFPNSTTNKGYIKQAFLSLNILSGTGIIKIAPIKSDWDDTVTFNTAPTIDKSNEISLNISSTGIQSIDFTELAEELWSLPLYGLALYTDDESLSYTFNILGNSVNYIYQSTYLLPPPVIYGNRVLLSWAPILIESGVALISLVLERDTSPDFSNPQVLYSGYSTLDDCQYNDLNLNQNTTYYYRIKANLAGPQVLTSEIIDISSPDFGYRKTLNPDNETYSTVITEGLSFDSPLVDYDFYTTPDRIELKPLSIGNLIGGRVSNGFAVEVINSYDAVDYDIKLRAANSIGVADERVTYALLPDGPLNDGSDDDHRTAIDLSLTPDFTDLVYPLSFSLSAGQKQIVYIRMHPTIYSPVGDGTFKIMLNGRPI